MYYIAWPTDGLTTTGEVNPRINPSAHVELLKRRQTQLEQLRMQIVNLLDVPAQLRTAALASIGVLPGVGQLLLNDESLNVELLKTRAPWLTIAPNEPLPPLEESPLAEAQGMTAQPATAQPWHITMIGQPATLSGAGVRIGVIDSGCGTSLPDLALPFAAQFAKYQPEQPAQGGRPPRPPRMFQTARMDFGSHGSKVCAFLAGNFSGVAKGATVIVAAVPTGLPTSNRMMVIVALDWLITTGCDIITTSVLTGGPGVLPTTLSLKAVDYAIEQARKVHKIVVTAAIGNGGGAVGKHQHPGLSAFAIGVGAVDNTPQHFGSAWGPIGPPPRFKPDIVAPGYKLQLPTSSTAHDVVGGTSFATPIVAAALALILEQDPTKKGDPGALTQKLLQLVRPVGSTPAPATNSVGVGLLDLSSL